MVAKRLELERCSDHVKTTFGVLEDNAALKDVRAKISNIDFFFIKPLLQLGYELLLSEMQTKKMGGHRLRFGDKISERPP